MSFLRGSTNYVWCTTSVLGKGATGAVFQGVNKKTGEPVAVKTFNQVSHMRPYDVQVREFEVLQKVSHDNIVKLLAIEDDQEGRGRVIVMELCTGGSLFNILDDPENTYGLPEAEFLLVLEHLTAGMKHLRDNNLVHRDLKPGNIMKFCSEDGQTIYKLTDFGAARELEENQQFVSLYGTEEYLHPDMYERAVLRKSVNRSFTANVDLWSIGVTLYHVATGNLPFRPYGGRKNKETMHQITTKKQPGVISGIQTTENGAIEWSRTLPPHCQLTAGLKMLVTPLLAGLLEESQKRMWPFDRFFTEVTHILDKQVLHLFYMNRGTSIEVYMDATETLHNLKEHIHVQTDVPAIHQLLLFDGDRLELKVEPTTTARGYPKTKVDEPILLFSVNNNNVSLPIELDLPKFPSFPSGVSVENDASLAKVACSVGHEIKRRVESYSKIDELIVRGVNEFVTLLKNILMKLVDRSLHLEDMVSVISDVADCVDTLLAKEPTNDDFQKVSLELASIKEKFHGVNDAVQQLNNRCVREDSVTREWNTLTRKINGPFSSRSSYRAKHFVERLRDSWQHLLRDRATRSLTYNDEQFHALEKIKVAETGKRLKQLLLENVKPSVGELAECLADWYKMAQTLFVQTQILEKDTIAYEEELRGVKERLNNLREDAKGDGASNCSSTETSINVPRLEISSGYKALLAYKREIMTLLRQNNELVEMIQSLSTEPEEFISIPDHTRL